MNNKRNNITNLKYYSLVATLILSGVFATITNKEQLNTTSLDKPYRHIWIMILCLFTGESCMLIVYYVKIYLRGSKRGEEEIESEKLPHLSAYKFILLTILDFTGTCLLRMSLSQLTASTFVMLTSSNLLFVAIFSKIILKTKYYRHKYLAMSIVLGSLILIGLSSLLNPVCSTKSTNNSLGIAFVMIATFLNGIRYILIDNFSHNYNYDPYRSIGWQGIWGVCICVPCLIAFQYVPCNSNEFTKIICTQDNIGNYYLENSLFAFQQIWYNKKLLITIILNVISYAVWPSAMEAVAMYSSSLSRLLISNLSTIIIWIYFLLPFHNTCHRERFDPMQFTGFIGLVLGCLINGEILVIPCCGLNKYTERAISLRRVSSTMDELYKLNKKRSIQKMSSIRRVSLLFIRESEEAIYKKEAVISQCENSSNQKFENKKVISSSRRVSKVFLGRRTSLINFFQEVQNENNADMTEIISRLGEKGRRFSRRFSQMIINSEIKNNIGAQSNKENLVAKKTVSCKLIPVVNKFEKNRRNTVCLNENSFQLFNMKENIKTGNPVVKKVEKNVRNSKSLNENDFQLLISKEIPKIKNFDRIIMNTEGEPESERKLIKNDSVYESFYLESPIRKRLIEDDIKLSVLDENKKEEDLTVSLNTFLSEEDSVEDLSDNDSIGEVIEEVEVDEEVLVDELVDDKDIKKLKNNQLMQIELQPVKKPNNLKKELENVQEVEEEEKDNQEECKNPEPKSYKNHYVNIPDRRNSYFKFLDKI